MTPPVFDVVEKRKERAKLIHDARTILDKAQGEERALSTEEDTRWEKMMSDADVMERDIAKWEKQIRAEGDLNKSVDPPNKPAPEGPAGEQRIINPRDTEEYRSAFRGFLRGTAGAEELRALQADADIAGGYLVPREQFVNQLIKAVDDAVIIRQLATVIPMENAESLGVPTLDTDVSDADWTAEITAASEDSSIAFGKREMKPNPLSKLVKISNKLLRQSSDVEALVRARLAYKFGVAQEKGFLTGHGAGQALGIFTAADSGISTGRDVSTGNTTTSPTFDGLKEAKYTLKGQYWSNARWIAHRDFVKVVAKLKDGEGRYLWESSVRLGEPDRLLNSPILMSEWAPNTFTTGLYVAVLGDYSKYWIVDALNMTVQRLVELYAVTNQVGFIGRQEVDGMPVLEEAFVRVKLA